MKKGPAFTFNTSREGIEARLGEMEMKIDRLRSMYEAYFMGQERMPPVSPRREMNRMMLEMQQVPIANASLRFRFQALSQKWVLHVTYWNRTLREIEAGTYRRDVARAQRHLAERGGTLTEEEALAIGIPKGRVKAFVARQQRDAAKKASEGGGNGDGPASAGLASPATSPTPSAPPGTPPASSAAPPPAQASNAASLPASPSSPAAPARPGPPPIPAHARRSPAPDAALGAVTLPGVSEPDFDDAYAKYLAAHRALGTTAEAASKDKIRTRLGKQLPQILAEQRCEKIRLEVKVEEGKVRLRAWPV